MEVYLVFFFLFWKVVITLHEPVWYCFFETELLILFRNDLVVSEPIDRIKHGEVIQLIHGITSRALNRLGLSFKI